MKIEVMPLWPGRIGIDIGAVSVVNVDICENAWLI